jgi:hypothetical protein
VVKSSTSRPDSGCGMALSPLGGPVGQVTADETGAQAKSQ